MDPYRRVCYKDKVMRVGEAWTCPYTISAYYELSSLTTFIFSPFLYTFCFVKHGFSGMIPKEETIEHCYLEKREPKEFSERARRIVEATLSE